MPTLSRFVVAMVPPAGRRRRQACGRLDRSRGRRSALRELEAAPRLALAVFLALDDGAVAGEDPALLEHRAQRRLEVGERPADAVPHGPGLTRQAAAGHRAHHVVLVRAAGRAEWLV